MPTALTPEQIAQAAYQAGFRGDGLWRAVAISGRESGGKYWERNQNVGTRDDSWGLMQINTLGANASATTSSLLRQLGYSGNLTDLTDPVANMRVAYVMSNSGTSWRPWGPYKGVSELLGTDPGGAQKAVANAQAQGLLGQPLNVDAGFGTSVGSGGGGGGGGAPGGGGLVGAIAGLPGDALGAATGAAGSAVDAVTGLATGWVGDLFSMLKPFALYAVVLLGGAGLIVLGAKRTVDPMFKAKQEQSTQTAAAVAPLVA